MDTKNPLKLRLKYNHRIHAKYTFINKTLLTEAIINEKIDVIKELLLSCNIDTFKDGLIVSLNISTLDIITLLIEHGLFNKIFKIDREWMYNIVSGIIHGFFIDFSDKTMYIMKLIISKIGLGLFHERFYYQLQDPYNINFLLSDNINVTSLDVSKLEFLTTLYARFDIMHNFSNDTLLIIIVRTPGTNLEVVKYLLTHIDNPNFINKRNNHDDTALMWAVYSQNYATVKILLDNNADVFLINREQRSALNIAIGINNVSILNLLRAYIDNPDNTLIKNLQLHTPNIKTIKELLGTGSNGNIKCQSAFLIISNLMKKQHGIDIIKLLLEHNLNANLKDIEYKTGLIHSASILGDIDIIRLLIQYSADINVTDKEDKSPLDYAISLGRIDIIKELLPLCNLNIFKRIKVNFLDKTTLNITKLLIKSDLFYKAFLFEKKWMLDTLFIIMHGFLHNFDDTSMEVCKLIISIIGIELFHEIFTYKLILLEKNMIELDINKIELLIQLGAKVDIVDPLTGNTPLLLGNVKNIKLEVIKYLVNNVDNKHRFINRESENGITALYRFVTSDIEIMKFLINNGGDINYRNKYGGTVLMRACKYPLDISYLITSGADINVQTNLGYTALMWAISGKMKHAIKTLLDNNADILMEDDDGNNSLDRAVKTKDKSILIMLCNYIGENNIDIDQSKCGNIINEYISKDILKLKDTFIRIISNSSNDSQDTLLINNLTFDKPNIDTIRNLLENGANANVQKKHAPIINNVMKSENGNDIIKLLLEYNLNANFRNRYSSDYLIHSAIKLNKIDIVRILIQSGADVNIINNKYETPLDIAITVSNADIIKELLLTCNIDTFINGIKKSLSDSKPDILRILMEDDLFNKAFEYPDERIYNMVPSIIKNFLDNFSSVYMELAKVIILKIGINIFRDSFTEKFILVDNYTIYASNNTIIDFLIKLGAKVDIVSKRSGDTPLITSARNSYTSLEVVKSLVNNTEDKSSFINKRNKKSNRALDLFLNSDSSIIKFLIENGGDVNYKNELGETFFMHACKSSFNISYLINKVTDIDTQSYTGETALMWAIKAENHIAITILLDNKPNILLQTKDKKNVLDITIDMNNLYLLKLLHEYITSNNINITPEYKKLIESYISRSRLRWKDACKSNNTAEINKYKKLFGIKDKDIKDICNKLDKKEQDFQDYKMKVINKCTNSEDLYGDDLKDMYPENFYSYEQNGITFCEDIRTMFKLVNGSEIVRNPFTREVLSASIIQDIRDKFEIYNIISTGE